MCPSADRFLISGSMGWMGAESRFHSMWQASFTSVGWASDVAISTIP